MTARRLLFRLAAGALPLALLAALTGCPPTKSSKNGTASVPAPVAIGEPLYAAVPMPTLKAPGAAPEPLTLSQGVVQFDQKIQVCAEAEGKIELVATPLTEGEVMVPGDKTIVKHPRDPRMLYRELTENVSLVTVGQTLARIDESQAAVQLEALIESLNAATDALKISGEAVKIAEDLAIVFRKSQQASKTELAQAESSLAQAKEKQAEMIINKARYRGEAMQTQKKIDTYQVKSPVNGKLLRILKNPGEYVKAGEPILEVQATNRFRVEAKVDVQVANTLSPGMPVVVEPARPANPQPYTARHRSEVTGVAVTAHPDRPLVVSAGLDSTAIVWDVTGPGKRQKTLVHPAGVGVRSVAVTGPQAKGLYLAATGGSDGRVRVWDLSNPDALPDAPREEYEEAHGSAVTVTAFSPDGNFLATAAGRDVFVWELATRKKKYALPTDARDDVTAVRFTPQGTLVVAARDKTVRVYGLGTAAAALDRAVEHRSGSVDVLGVSADGGRMLFDQDAGRIDVISLGKDARSVQTLQVSGGVRFSGLAVFSPDDTHALTGAGDAETKGELQLWKLPENGARGSERRRLVAPGRSPITAAAFSPDPKHAFVVVGTQAGVVYYFTWSSTGVEGAECKGTISTITQLDARSSQVRVQVENPGGLEDVLKDRGSATIIIDPTQPIAAKPEAPAAPAAPVAAPPAANPPKPLPLPGVGAQGPAVVPDVLRPGEVLPVSATQPVKDTAPNPVPAVRTPAPVGVDPFKMVAPAVRVVPDK